MPLEYLRFTYLCDSEISLDLMLLSTIRGLTIHRTCTPILRETARSTSSWKRSTSTVLGLISDIFVYSSTVYQPTHNALLPRWSANPKGIHALQSRRPYMSLRDMVLGINPSDTEVEQFNKDFPQCKVVKGRYLSPWSNKTEKSFSEVIDYLWNRKQNKLVLPNLEKKSLKELLNPQEIVVKDLLKLTEDENKSALAVSESLHAYADKDVQQKLRVTWIGHATCYFELEGVKFITDPVFGDYASPVPFLGIGPKRFFPPACKAEDLPIDVVLLSHTHYDHMCAPSVTAIGNSALWLVPLGVKDLLNKEFGITNCVEMNWWESHFIPNKKKKPINNSSEAQIASAQSVGGSAGGTVPDNHIEIAFTPAKHWTSRSIFDRNMCLWGSFAVMSQSQRVFFSGDTAFCDVFKQIGLKYGPFDLALVPIGAYEPRYFMKHHHCNPEEAIQIHHMLQAKQSLAIHWGTFPLADEDVVEPALELGRCRKLAGIPAEAFFTVRPGETFTTRQAANSDFSVMHASLQAHYDAHIEAKMARKDAQTKKFVQVKNALNVKKRVKEKMAARRERKEEVAQAKAKAQAHLQDQVSSQSQEARAKSL